MHFFLNCLDTIKTFDSLYFLRILFLRYVKENKKFRKFRNAEMKRCLSTDKYAKFEKTLNEDLKTAQFYYEM